MKDETKYQLGEVIKSADLPDELKAEAGDADVWGYASVETIDLDNDIVRVKGISLERHEPNRPIKLRANHQKALPTGESPIIGRIVNFKTVTHKSLGVPALAFGAKFASTPLGKHYKTLYEDGCGPDFSIGFKPVEGKPIEKGGIDYEKTVLREVSCVTDPANDLAVVMRSHDAANGETLKQLNDKLDTILTRLEDLEDALAARSNEAEQSAGHTPPPSEKSESDASVPTLADLVNALKAITPRK